MRVAQAPWDANVLMQNMIENIAAAMNRGRFCGDVGASMGKNASQRL